MSVKTLVAKPSIDTLSSIVRYFPAWWRHSTPESNSVKSSLPWISFGAIKYLNKILNPDMVVFEYGSGGSTLFWSSRVKKVVSIEHDQLWYENIEKELLQRGVHNVQYKFIDADSEPEFDKKSPFNPDDYISTDDNFRGKNFERYVKSIDSFPDAFFDIIIVDGRARISCIKHALDKLKTNGYLVIDNTEREYYLSPFKSVLKDWNIYESYSPVPFSYGFSQTTILQKK